MFYQKLISLFMLTLSVHGSVVQINEAPNSARTITTPPSKNILRKRLLPQNLDTISTTPQLLTTWESISEVSNLLHNYLFLTTQLLEKVLEISKKTYLKSLRSESIKQYLEDCANANIEGKPSDINSDSKLLVNAKLIEELHKPSVEEWVLLVDALDSKQFRKGLSDQSYFDNLDQDFPDDEEGNIGLTEVKAEVTTERLLEDLTIPFENLDENDLTTWLLNTRPDPSNPDEILIDKNRVSGVYMIYKDLLERITENTQAIKDALPVAWKELKDLMEEKGHDLLDSAAIASLNTLIGVKGDIKTWREIEGLVSVLKNTVGLLKEEVDGFWKDEQV